MFLNSSTDISPSLALTVSISDVSNFLNSPIVIFCSLVTLDSQVACDASNESREKAGSLPVLPGGLAAAASEDDFSRSTVFFSPSIDPLIGSFRACFFFFFFLTISSSEDDDVESSDWKLDDGTLFFLQVLFLLGSGIRIRFGFRR